MCFLFQVMAAFRRSIFHHLSILSPHAQSSEESSFWGSSKVTGRQLLSSMTGTSFLINWKNVDPSIGEGRRALRFVGSSQYAELGRGGCLLHPPSPCWSQRENVQQWSCPRGGPVSSIQEGFRPSISFKTALCNFNANLTFHFYSSVLKRK